MGSRPKAAYWSRAARTEESGRIVHGVGSRPAARASATKSSDVKKVPRAPRHTHSATSDADSKANKWRFRREPVSGPMSAEEYCLRMCREQDSNLHGVSPSGF